MSNKIKELLKNKVVKVVFVIIILVLSTFIMNYLFNLGIKRNANKVKYFGTHFFGMSYKILKK